jgi:hypothetical protein
VAGALSELHRGPKAPEPSSFHVRLCLRSGIALHEDTAEVIGLLSVPPPVSSPFDQHRVTRITLRL